MNRPWVLRASVLVLLLAVAILARIDYRFPGGAPLYIFDDSYKMMVSARLIDFDDLRSSGVWVSPNLIPWSAVTAGAVTGLPLEGAAILVSMATACLSIVLLFLIVERHMGLVVAAAGAAVLALSPLMIVGGGEPEKAIFVVAFFQLAVFALESNARATPRLVLASVSMGAALFSHYSGLFFFAAGAGYLAIRRGSFLPHPRLWANVVAGGGSVVPLVLWRLAQHQAGNQDVFFQDYSDVAVANLSSGFSHVEGWVFATFVRLRAGDLVYWFGLAGAAISAIWAKRRGDPHSVSWLVVVFGAFALQYPSGSHQSRYVIYLIPPLAALCPQLLWPFTRPRRSRAVAMVIVSLFLLLPFAGYTSGQYAFQRQVAEVHKEMGDYIRETNLLANSTILYDGRPGTIYYSLSGIGQYENYIVTGLHWNATRSPLHDLMQNHTPTFFLLDRTTRFNGVFVGDQIRSHIQSLGVELEVVHRAGPPDMRMTLFRVNATALKSPH